MNSDKIRNNKNEKINLYNSNLDKNGNVYNQNRNIEDKFRNKTIVDNLEYDDSYDVDDIKTFRDFVANRKFLYILSIITFIVVCIVVVKTFYFGRKIDKYEEFFTEITSIEDNIVKVYEGNKVDNDVIRKMVASELINCIKSPIDIDNLPDEVSNIINEINNFYRISNNYFGFGYKDIFTGFTVSYNANQKIFAASTIKAPTDIYIYEMASQGNVDLDEVITYTGNYYNTGTGVLKNKSINSKYDIRTLLNYSIVTSDNAAHNMLIDKYGRSNMLEFWNKLGTNAIFTTNNNWGNVNVHDALIYMNELYDFYSRDSIYGEEIMNNFLNAYPKFLSGSNGFAVANKSGWSGTAIHDVAIIFADNPYILVALSNLGETDNYQYYFNMANKFGYELHKAYWKYKISNCENIKQY